MCFDVKNTTVRIISDLFCPHYCCRCGKIGSILCDCCKNDLCSDNTNNCLACGTNINSFCPTCSLPFGNQWTFSPRSDELAQMISAFKYDSIRAFGKAFAELLSSCLPPQLPQNTVIVPMPTIRKHIRERGFDHAYLIAKELGRLRHLPCTQLIGRAKNTVQVGASRDQRLTQAKSAYKLLAPPDPNKTYLVIDDVWTTGASLCAACELLTKNGARLPMVAVLARSIK